MATDDQSPPISRQAGSVLGRRRFAQWGAVAAVVISIAALAAIDQYGGQAATEANRRLEKFAAELAVIPPPNGLTLYKETNLSKPGQAMAAREYTGPISYAAARAHYDPLLAARGYVFIREAPSLRSPYACYQRGDEKASVEVPGDIKDLGPVLLLTLSWGLSPC